MSELQNFDQLRQSLIDRLPEIKDLSDPKLKQFDKDFMELMELLMFSLLRDKDNYFGNFLVQLNRRVDYRLPACAAVSFKVTYFDLLVNPFLMLRWNLTVMKEILIHEIYHIMNEHLKRFFPAFEKYPQLIINLATDAAINQYLKLPEGFVSLKSLREDWGIKGYLEEKREAEYYFKKLLEEYKNNEEFKEKVDKRSQQDGRSMGKGDGEDDGSGDGNGENGIQKHEDYSDAHGSWKESDDSGEFETMKDVVKNMSNQAAGQARGLIPGELQELIKKLNEKPIIPWWEVLRRMVGSIPVPYKKTIMRRNRRQPERPDLRGRLSDHVVEIFVAIDTSGSMSDKAIAYCINEVFNIVKYVKHKITIIECDSQIGKVYEAKKPDEVQTKVSGRGGTCFSPVFEYIKSIGKKDALLVFFTDGGGERQLSIRPYHHKTLWVLTGESGHLSLSEPYGEVKELRLDRKWKEA